MKNSKDYPLHIDAIAVPGFAGQIGMTFCPGKHQQGSMSGDWQRCLETDMTAIRQWGAAAIVSFLEDHEIEHLDVSDTRQHIPDGIEYIRLPIPDAGVPDAHWETQWRVFGPFLEALLRSGKNILLHCKGGLGRTGMVAAKLLVDMGYSTDQAIDTVRNTRTDTIENAAQEQYVKSLTRVLL